jgi:RimJ/RimL family protein N-acetyltransferase
MEETAMLEGKLVRLRPMEPEDVDRYYEWINDEEVKEFLSSRYYFSRAAEAEWLKEHVSSPLSFTNLSFAMDTLDGRHIGSIGLGDASPHHRRAELGIAIGDKEFWSRGYGTDAICTLLRFAFDEINLHRVHLKVDERNMRAIACYRKCGFVEEGHLRDDRYARGSYHDSLIMGILDREFRDLHGAASDRR